MRDRLPALREVLATELPITQHLGVVIERLDGGCLALRLPLAANVNHKGTMFAGSLNAVATLAGWSLLWLLLDEATIPAHVVIQDSSVRYLRPVTADCVAVCCAPDAAALERFRATLRRRRVARLALETEIRQNGELAVAFSGRYVVQRLDAGD